MYKVCIGYYNDYRLKHITVIMYNVVIRMKNIVSIMLLQLIIMLKYITVTMCNVVILITMYNIIAIGYYNDYYDDCCIGCCNDYMLLQLV